MRVHVAKRNKNTSSCTPDSSFCFLFFTYVYLRDLVYLYEMRSQTLGADNYVTGTFFKTLVVKVAERTP